uniref:UDENN domain-containing protein n=1 Tax=Gouania willdenowi TaxID=441366 RepID=A0A8C5HL64_GOUWI
MLCSSSLLFLRTLKDANALVFVVSPTAHTPAFAYSGKVNILLLWCQSHPCVFSKKLSSFKFNSSYLPWFEVFYKLLNNLADHLSKGQELGELLSALYEQPVPQTAGTISLPMIPYFIAPDTRSLPSIPENRNLTEMIVAVDVENLLQLYASMLFERRILIFASKLSILTSCLHALNAILYPMYWQHIFIPVLPPHLLDYCCAPMPFLIGVHSTLSEWVRNQALEEIVILNVDTNTLETPFDDLNRVPPEVMSRLKVCLQQKAVLPGYGISHAFLKSQALLFGGYRNALQGHKAGEIYFNEKMFVDHKSQSMKQFLQCAIHLQFFKQVLSISCIGASILSQQDISHDTAAHPKTKNDNNNSEQPQ